MATRGSNSGAGKSASASASLESHESAHNLAVSIGPEPMVPSVDEDGESLRFPNFTGTFPWIELLSVAQKVFWPWRGDRGLLSTMRLFPHTDDDKEGPR